MPGKTNLVWFRCDLRVGDNPALRAAIDSAETVHALFIDETDPTLRPVTGAARWWRHHSLRSLAGDLAKRGIPLTIETGSASDIITAYVKKHAISGVFWNRRYSPAERDIDTAIKQTLGAAGVAAHSSAAHVLIEPWEIETGQGKPYSVFTPFWKTLKTRHIDQPMPAPQAQGKPISIASVDDGYTEPKWSKKLAAHWQIGEHAARRRLDDFLYETVADYPTGRDIPSKPATSRLSPHLRHGEISPRQVWHTAMAYAHKHPSKAEAIDKFLSELAWRDFNYHQLYHRPDIATHPMQPKYENLSWRNAPSELERWQRGQTGFPIVDAGMRELWETGVMHNRVRMLVASLLTKNMLIDWRQGEAWFWDCLVDADIASNPGNWQWVAGSGLDASPYFRIFNPVTQGNRFDEAGGYVRQWVPEIAELPDAWVQNPHDAPSDVLKSAGITLGKSYPKPVVDLKTSRQRALDAAKSL